MINFDNCTVGQQWAGGQFYLVEQDIIDFALFWDPQPFHADRELAKKSFYGGITAPSAYIFAVASKLFNEVDDYAGIGALNHQFDISNPGRAGDTLSLTLTCLDKRASKSKIDRGIVTFGLELMNQNDELILSMKSQVMLYRELSL